MDKWFWMIVVFYMLGMPKQSLAHEIKNCSQVSHCHLGDRSKCEPMTFALCIQDAAKEMANTMNTVCVAAAIQFQQLAVKISKVDKKESQKNDFIPLIESYLALRPKQLQCLI